MPGSLEEFWQQRAQYCAVLPASVHAKAVEQTLLIEIESQQLRRFHRQTEQVRYPVSTAANGAGCRQGSWCTPLGWHFVAQRFGDGEPPGTVFRGRQPVAVTNDLRASTNDDLITSRILWLQGLQPGYNAGGSVDSKARYIYIHGTVQEHLIGEPVSHGCIRMRNDDIIGLYNDTVCGVPVFISSVALHD